MSARLTALAAGLDAPLLVTDLTNVLYLTGFDSSNAALLVEPGGGATLYTDFRYIESARAVEGVEPVLAKRALMRDVAERLPERVQFEADVLPYAQWQALAGGPSELVPSTRHRRGAARGQGRGGGREASAVRAAIADRGARGADRRDVGRPQRARDRVAAARAAARARRRRARRSTASSRPGPNGAQPHAHPTDRIVDRGTLVTVDWGVQVDGYCSDCTRTFSTGRLPDRLREAYDVCLEAQQRACDEHQGGDDRASRPTRSRATPIDGRRLRRELRPRARPRRRARRPRGAAPLDASRRDTLEPGNVVTIEPGIYLDGPRRRADRGSRDRPRRRRRAPDVVPEGRSARRVGQPGRTRWLATLARRWPRSSPPTSSATGCTSSSRARPGASSSSST